MPHNLHQSSELNFMAQEVGRAHSLLNSNEHEEARDLLQRLHAEARRLGHVSPYVLWGLAVASDYLGDYENSTRCILEAITLDPLSPQYRHSFDIIANNVRKALASSARPAGDPEVPKLYELLLQAGEANVESHLRMAQWHLAHGNPAEARLLLEAVTRLNPSSTLAWQMLAKAAEALEDAALGEHCSKTMLRLRADALPAFMMTEARG